MPKIRVYLDNCAYNRPYDNQNDIRVVRKLQFQNNFLIKKAKYRTLDRYFAGLVRQPTGLSNKSINIRLESEAKLFIQEKIKDNQIDLVWSSMNSYENNDNPSPEKRERITAWKNMAVEYCKLNENILKKAEELQSQNLRAKDAIHIAAAIYSQCGYFITTDRKILNKNIDGIVVLNPVAFVEEYSE